MWVDLDRDNVFGVSFFRKLALCLLRGAHQGDRLNNINSYYYYYHYYYYYYYYYY